MDNLTPEEAPILLFGDGAIDDHNEDTEPDVDPYDPDTTADEPEEGDYVLSPRGPLGSSTAVSQYDKHLCTFSGNDDMSADEAALAFIRRHADKGQFWPSAWMISDHGNAHLLTY